MQMVIPSKFIFRAGPSDDLPAAIAHQIGLMYDDIYVSLLSAVSLVNRGDPAAADFTAFTTDGTWKVDADALDLSSIVPVSTIAALVRVTVADGGVGNVFILKKNGQTNDFNSLVIRTQVADITNDGMGLVFVDANRKIAYWGTNVVFSSISVIVCGWVV